MAGRLAVCVTDRLDVCVGMNQVGKSPFIGRGTVSDDGGMAASVIVFDTVSRGSMKKSSGASPLLVMLSGTVTGVPEASVVVALSGSPAALALVSLNTMFPV